MEMDIGLHTQMKMENMNYMFLMVFMMWDLALMTTSSVLFME